MFIHRALEKTILEASKVFPVLLITGPRQVGKTTLLKHLSKNDSEKSERTYVTLDDPMIRVLAKNDPALFFQRYTPPLIIDEIQYAPELLPYIKIYVDKEQRKGDFWLTGSQIFHTMKDVSESLAGRVGIIPMQGLSLSEIRGIPNIPYSFDAKVMSERMKIVEKLSVKEVYEYIHKGSMPALYSTPQDIERFYASYIDTYINRDIRALSEVQNMLSFQQFLIACAARTSQMLNYAELAADVGISQPTAKKWISLLVSSGILVLVQPYFNNALKRIVKAPNLYFMDTGLCAYLTRWTSSEALEVSAMSGAFFETFVVSEIIKSYLGTGKRPPIYYYRDSNKKEIDLIIEENGVLKPIEIKKSASPTKRAVRHFSVLHKTGKTVTGGSVICMSEELLPLTEGNWAVPVWLL